jgi:NADH dehydrogenase
MNIKAKTVVWTAGVKAHKLLSTLGLETDKKGRVIVDEHLRAKGKNDVYVVGDAAATKFSGMAQTALQDGAHVADVIVSALQRKTPPAYLPRIPAYAVPVGPGWAAFCVAGWCAFGRLGWFMRRFLDLYVFVSLLPFRKAMTAFRSTNQTEEFTKSCPIR